MFNEYPSAGGGGGIGIYLHNRFHNELAELTDDKEVVSIVSQLHKDVELVLVEDVANTVDIDTLLDLNKYLYKCI